LQTTTNPAKSIRLSLGDRVSTDHVLRADAGDAGYPSHQINPTVMGFIESRLGPTLSSVISVIRQGTKRVRGNPAAEGNPRSTQAAAALWIPTLGLDDGIDDNFHFRWFWWCRF
jgi:hypothetical protein